MDLAPVRPLAATLLLAMLAAATTAVLGVEALSALGAIQKGPLRVLSALCLAVLFGVIRRASRSSTTRLNAPSPPLFLAGLLAIGGITLLIAVVAAPNTWDSMTYHLARVAEWYDHGHVRHYATSIDRQLWQPPFAEYLVLVGYGALGGRDYLANLPQWLGGLGAVLVSMEIARQLGARIQSRLWVGLCVATAPILILQGTSTHTDLLGGFWIGVAAWLALAECTSPTRTATSALAFAAALALAIGTKGTSLPLGVPWLLLYVVASLRTSPRVLVTRLFAVAVVMLVILGPHLLRNIELFGTPLGPESVQRMLRPASLDPGALFSNALAHGSLQFGTPWPEVNRALLRGVLTIHSTLGVDLSRLYPYFGGFNIVPWTTREDIAGNPVHVLLAVAGGTLILRHWRGIQRVERAAAIAFLAGVAAFAVSVRWGPYIARLHTPMIILMIPCLALAFERRWPRVARISLAVAFALALPALVLNQSRPLLSDGLPQSISIGARSVLTTSRHEQYFATRPELLRPYETALRTTRDRACGRVALKAGYDSFEYPFWALGRPYGITFEHYVRRTPIVAATSAAGPCALFAVDQLPGWRPPSAPPDAAPAMTSGPVVVWPGPYSAGDSSPLRSSPR